MRLVSRPAPIPIFRVDSEPTSSAWVSRVNMGASIAWS
jgi:hypothetical protein